MKLFEVDIQVEVFSGSHGLDVFDGFIFVATKMQGAMKNDTVKFISKSRTENFSILANAGNADINFAVDIVPGASLFKGENIGVKVMAKKLAV